jgi:hypothetical protein
MPQHPCARIAMFVILCIVMCVSKSLCADDQPVTSVFELPLNFGTVCEFSEVSWRISGGGNSHVSITTATLGIPAMGGFWGAKYSEAEAIENGEGVFSPPGRTLKLVITVRGATKIEAPPIESMTVQYRPLSDANAPTMTHQVDLSTAKPRLDNYAGYTLKHDVVTPHIKWAKPYVRGPVRVLFLVSFDMQREVVELHQRLDMRYHAPTYVKYGNRWSSATQYRNRLKPEAVIEHTARLLDENEYDTIVIAGVEWAALGSAVRQRIMKRVEAGAGLVLCLDPEQVGNLPDMQKLAQMQGFTPGPGGRKVDEHSQLELTGEKMGRLVTARDHFITAGVPFETLPPVNYFPYANARRVLVKSEDGDPVMAIGRHGQGRIVQLTWSNPDYWGGTCAITPAVDPTGIHYRYWEYFLSLVSRAIVWSADKLPDVMIREMSATDDAIRVKLANTRTAEGFAPRDTVDVTVRATIYDMDHRPHAELEQSARIEAGNKTTVALAPASQLLPGRYLVDVIVSNGGRVENWATTLLKIESEVTIDKVTLNRNRYAPGETVHVSVSVAGDAANAVARLELSDTFDRMVGRYEAPIVDGKVTFAHQLDDVRSHYMTARFELRVGDRTVNRTRRTIEVAYAHAWDDYEVILWGFVGTQITDYVRRSYYPAFRDMGITAILDAVELPEIVYESARANMRIAPIGGTPGKDFHGARDLEKKYQQTGDKSVLARKPCLSDPAYWRTAEAQLGGTADTFGWLAPVGYGMGDEFALIETGVPRRTSPVGEVCYSPHCMAGFRQSLRKQYESLNALNDQWGTEFATWDDIVPKTRFEMRDVTDGNYSSWADHRAFMDDVFASAFEKWNAALQAKDPAARVGISGNSNPSAYNGFDYGKLGPVLAYMNMYIWISQGELWTSMFPGKHYTLWSGYGQSDAEVRYGIWFSVLNQHRGISYFKVPWFVWPDLTLNPHGRFIRDNVRPVREGIGKIMMTAQRQHDGVAILYSQPSMRAAWITGAGKPMARTSPHEYHERDDTGPDNSWDEVRYIDNLDTYCMLLKAAGVNYRFMSNGQLDQGALESGQYKALILPMAMAMSDASSDAIRRFVNAGGFVLADVLPGVMDEHCRVRQSGCLSDVFGATLSGVRWSRKAVAADIPSPMFGSAAPEGSHRESIVGCAPLERTTALAGRAGIEGDGEYELILQNDFGRGHAVYLNYFMSNLADRPVWESNANGIGAIRKYLGKTGIAKITETGRPALHYDTSMFASGDLRYLAVLRWYVTDVHDSGEVRMKLANHHHVYNVRTKQYLGSTDTISTKLSPGDGGFFAMLPYEVAGVAARTGKATYAPGEVVKAGLVITTADGRKPGDHVVRVQLIDPAGNVRDYETVNAVTNAGELSHTFVLALNDPPGTWTIAMQDVISGQSANATFQVR